MLIRRFLAWLLRRPSPVWVRLQFEDGAKVLGPMSREAADLFLAYRVSPQGAWDGRRVVSARIVVP